MSDRTRRPYRRQTSTSPVDGDRVGHHLSSRFQQFRQGFGLPFRSAGRPDKAFFQVIGTARVRGPDLCSLRRGDLRPQRSQRSR